MVEKIGFFKRAQKFRSNLTNENYFPILDRMYQIASIHKNNLPHSFELENIDNFSVEDIQFILLELYPNRKYSCKLINGFFFCSL